MPGESDINMTIVEETPIVIEMVETGAPGNPGEAGGLQSIGAGDGIQVDDTDPENPVVSADVTSVHSRVGDVVAVAGDYNEDQIDIEDPTVYEDMTGGTVTGNTVKELFVSLITSFSTTIGSILGSLSDIATFITTKAFDKTVDDLDDITAGTTNKHFTGTEKTKLGGIATGATANDTDANLRARSSHTGVQAISTVTDLQTTLDAKEVKADKNQPSGYAGLGVDGKLLSAQLPSITVTDTFVVASQAAMLALSAAETGDVAVRTDVNKSFILKGTSYSTLADWQELLTPTDAVSSVNGRNGAVTGLAEQASLQAHIDDTANPHAVTKTQVGLPNVPNVDATARANHTGTQLAATISDFVSTVAAQIAAQIGVSLQAYSATLTTWASKTAPSGTVVGTTDTQKLTNKRNQKRTVVVTQSATPSINTDNTDVAQITGLAQDITSVSVSGTPDTNDMMIVQITDNGTARAITWGSSFEASTVALPSTTVISTMLMVGFIWTGSKWRCVAVA